MATPSNPRLYPVISRAVGTVQCTECERRVSAPEGATARCPSHRNNATPLNGWAWLSNREAALLQVLREQGWVDEALQNVRSVLRRIEDAALADQFEALDVATPTSDPPQLEYGSESESTEL